MSVADLLLNRNTHARLVEPGPTEAELRFMISAALRAPDHGHLQPWQFVLIEGDRRHELGKLFSNALGLAGVTEPVLLEKAKKAPMRAPVILSGLLDYKPHPKISREEQAYSVAAALYAAQLAAESLGFGAIWRTGSYATSAEVIRGLGGKTGDEVVGFLYLGTREGPSKLLPPQLLESRYRRF